MQPRSQQPKYDPSQRYNPGYIQYAQQPVNNRKIKAADIEGFRQVPDGSLTRTQFNTQTRIKECHLYGSNNLQNLGVLADGADYANSHVVQVPDDYVSGDITVKYIMRPAASPGGIRMDRYAYRMRNGQPLYTFFTAVNADAYFASTAIVQGQYTLSAAGFKVSDTLRLDFIRHGADPADTLVANIDIDLMWIEYTGYA